MIEVMMNFNEWCENKGLTYKGKTRGKPAGESKHIKGVFSPASVGEKISIDEMLDDDAKANLAQAKIDGYTNVYLTETLIHPITGDPSSAIYVGK